MTTTIIRIVVFTTLLSATTAAWSRTWTDSTGKFKIEAELEKVAGGTVTLRKKNGTTIDIAIKRLSKADQAFIAAEKQHQECPMEVVGYLITDVLQGGLGTTGGRIRPKGKSARFVVIVVKLPRGELIPSESSYKVLVRRKPKKDRRPRENMQEFDPGRFTIYWDKKSKRTGHLMSNWILAEKPGEQPKGTIIGFSAGFSS
ncbi:MAG: hypothetical protein IIA67_13595 [Planctomycetes bacterium]|nr:hypothetical protein [Planctomycetota bacterium]